MGEIIRAFGREWHEPIMRLAAFVGLILAGGLFGALTTAIHNCDIRHLRWWLINIPFWLLILLLAALLLAD